MSQAKFPVLAANITYKDTGKLFTGAAYTIVERSGVKVAIIGVDTPNIPTWDSTKVSALSFAPMSKKKTAGIVILLVLLACLGLVSAKNAKAQRALLEKPAQTSQTPSPTPETTPTPEPTPSPTPTGPYADKPDIDITSWEYLLANAKNPIGDYAPELGTLEGQKFDKRIIDAMWDATAANIIRPVSQYSRRSRNITAAARRPATAHTQAQRVRPRK